MNEMIKCLTVFPGIDPMEADLENDNEVYQAIVGGHYQCLPYIGQKFNLLCNDDGKRLKMQPNFWYSGDVVVGPAVFVGTNEEGDDFGSLTDQYIRILKEVVPDWRKKMNMILGARKEERK